MTSDKKLGLLAFCSKCNGSLNMRAKDNGSDRLIITIDPCKTCIANEAAKLSESR